LIRLSGVPSLFQCAVAPFWLTASFWWAVGDLSPCRASTSLMCESSPWNPGSFALPAAVVAAAGSEAMQTMAMSATAAPRPMAAVLTTCLLPPG
jgi:hypothetical protein